MRSLALGLAATFVACAPLARESSIQSSELGASAALHIGAMGPLDMQTEAEWQSFESDLSRARALGITSISVDVWWGQVERAGDQQFDWSWVDRAAKTITAAGLSWRPVLAFHACGGNVGDTCHVPIPEWVFGKYGEAIKYVSAQGHTTNEVISVWATPIVLEQYRELFIAFAERYANYAPRTSGIAIGLGPASELRYPSYNSHDVDAGYPGPGVVQASSEPARASFASSTASFADWYRDSLLEHGRLVLGTAADVFQASPFRGSRLSARVPGIHWRAADTRAAEISAGLVSADDDLGADETGHGYAPLVKMIADLRARPDAPNFALEYTCLEKGNGEGGPAVASLAEALVFWVASEAYRQGVPIGGENALAGGLLSDDGWNHIENAVRWSHYDELTFLRLHDIVTSEVAKRRIVQLASVR